MSCFRFDSLTLDGKIAHFTSVARRALPLFGFPEDATLKLLNFTENATFLVTFGISKVIMRVHRLYYTSVNSIRTELSFIRYLSKHTDLTLASPIPALDGSDVVTIATPALEEYRQVVCFSFVEGKAPCPDCDSNGGVGDLVAKVQKLPDAITYPAFKEAARLYDKFGKIGAEPLSEHDVQFFTRMGRIAATIHAVSKEWKAPDYYERIEWDIDGTFGRYWNNFYGATYRNRKWLKDDEIAVLDRAVDLLKERLYRYRRTKDNYGMIHSDLRAANLLVNGDQVAVLDFDDCGRGWYMYEIAGIVALLEYTPQLPEMLLAIVRGYEEILPLTQKDKDEIMSFVLMRRIGMLQSLESRIGSVAAGEGESTELTPQILEFYAAGTVVQARQYLETYAVKPAASFAFAER